MKKIKWNSQQLEVLIASSSFSLCCTGCTRGARASWAAGFAWSSCKFLIFPLCISFSLSPVWSLCLSYCVHQSLHPFLVISSPPHALWLAVLFMLNPHCLIHCAMWRTPGFLIKHSHAYFFFLLLFLLLLSLHASFHTTEIEQRTL